MAVDLGWIEHERQVGQTGKSVRPELYIACGISGASHHLEGMSESRHVVAIDTNPHTPLVQRADLALQGDLHQVLHELDRLLEPAT
jgi:electron transfer flavoprotein alpha subunit